VLVNIRNLILHITKQQHWQLSHQSTAALLVRNSIRRKSQCTQQLPKDESHQSGTASTSAASLSDFTVRRPSAGLDCADHLKLDLISRICIWWLKFISYFIVNRQQQEHQSRVTALNSGAHH